MENTVTSTNAKTRNPMVKALALRNFRLLWLGQATSLLGDQFHMVAGAWLVLKMTSGPLALNLPGSFHPCTDDGRRFTHPVTGQLVVIHAWDFDNL